MSFATDMETARDNIAARIKDLTENPKPDYSIDGQSISWGAYLGQLTTALKEIESAIASGTPYEIHSVGFTL